MGGVLAGAVPHHARVGSSRHAPLPVRHVRPADRQARRGYHLRLPLAAGLAGLLALLVFAFVPSVSRAAGCPNEPARQGASAALPDCRAYEMVTPPVKNDAIIGKEFIGLGTYFSEDGNRLMAPTIQCFGEVGSCVGERGLEGTIYQFERGPAGWGSRAVSLPAPVFGVSSVWQADPDTGLALLSAPLPNGPDELYRVASDGSYEPIGPVSETLRYPGETREKGSLATADLSHVVIESNRAEWEFDKSEHETMYEYSGVGNVSPQLVGVTGPAGSTDLVSVCGTELFHAPASLSADGRTVYFEAQPCAGGTGVNAKTPVPAYELYARVDGSRTVKISERLPASCTTAPCLGSPPGDALFQGASSDGSRAFFLSTQQLTDDATEDTTSADSTHFGECPGTHGVGGCNLYESECPAHCEDPAKRRLIDVSAGDSSGGGPRVQGVTAMSPDGSHIYFVAKGVLSGEANSEGQRAESGAENLYLYDDAEPGHVTFITQLSPEDENEFHGLGERPNLTPDGRFLVFQSHRALTRDDTRGEGPTQVYRYDAQTRKLVRISVGQHGYDNNGNAGVGRAEIQSAAAGSDDGVGYPRMDPTMSNDGSFVFFESPVGLTPQALNDVRTASGGLANNVYEWHEGTVSLISDGRDTEASELGLLLIGASGSGADVFFKTADPLVPQDTDTQRDIYDAHICSAASPCPTPVTAPVPCVGEGCHSPAAPSAQPPAPATSTFTGPGDLTPPPLTVVPVHQTAAQLRAQKLTGALKACRKTRSKQRRAACEKRARRAYGRHT